MRFRTGGVRNLDFEDFGVGIEMIFSIGSELEWKFNFFAPEIGIPN